MNRETLYIVYNANSGLINGVKNSLHKLIQPATYPCKLCELTHGYLAERTEWKRFLIDLKDNRIGAEILHKDELSQYPFKFEELPGIYSLRNGNFSLLLGTKDLEKFNSIDKLIVQLRDHLGISSLSGKKASSYTH